MRFFGVPLLAELLRMTPIYTVSGWTLIGFRSTRPFFNFIRQYATIADPSKRGEDRYFLGDHMLIKSVSSSD
jgi:hypothetical protein